MQERRRFIGTSAIVDIIMIFKRNCKHKNWRKSALEPAVTDRDIELRGVGGGVQLFSLPCQLSFFQSFPLCLPKVGGPGPLRHLL